MKSVSVFALAALITAQAEAANQFFDVVCYLAPANGGNATRTYEGTLYGSAIRFEGRIEVSGRPVQRRGVSNHNLKAPCAPDSEPDTDGSYGYSKVNNLDVYSLGYEMVEVSCDLGSPVTRYGSLANFKAAKEANNKRHERSYGNNRYGYVCVDTTEIEKQIQ